MIQQVFFFVCVGGVCLDFFLSTNISNLFSLFAQSRRYQKPFPTDYLIRYMFIRGSVIKLFTVEIMELSWKARGFVDVGHLHPSVIFVGRAEAHPSVDPCPQILG